MFLVAARACTVTVLLTAAAVRAEETRNRLPPTPYSDPVAAMPWLRCEPTPLPRTNPCHPRTMGPVAGPVNDRVADGAASLSSRDHEPTRDGRRAIDRVPFVVFWESRSSALFLGVDRHGVGGVHFERRSRTNDGERGPPAPPLQPGWQSPEPQALRITRPAAGPAVESAPSGPVGPADQAQNAPHRALGDPAPAGTPLKRTERQR